MTRDRTYLWVIRVFRAFFRALGLRFLIEGEEHIPSAGPAVLACNHLSYLDFTFVGLAARRRGRLVRFMAKESTFTNGVTGPLMRGMRHIPVDRDSGAAAYRRAARALTAGEVVGIFPEATISRAWTLKSFKQGAAALCVTERVPLVPVVLWAPQRTLTVDRRYSLRRGKTIMVLIGEPIVAGPEDTRAEVDAELRRRMQGLLERAWRTYPDLPRGGDDQWWVPRELGGTAPTPDEAGVLEREHAQRSAAKRAAKAAEAARKAAPR